MGSICTRPEDELTAIDQKTKDNMLIDSMIIPQYPLNKLKFLKNFQDKFNVLRNIQIVEFINLLNNYKIDDSEAAEQGLKFSEFMLTKNNWLKFINTRVLSHPCMPSISSNFKILLSNFYDDVFDSVLRSYNYFYSVESNFVPKIVLISFAFNYCNMKISQKIDIFLNLFSNESNQIEFNNQVYTFFYCMITFAFDFPIQFIVRYNSPENLKEFFNIGSSKEFEKFFDDAKRDQYMRDFFIAETKNIFGQEENKKYTREEFKKYLLDCSENGGVWILDNNLVRAKMERLIK